jgi:hypothetical protein
LCCEGALVWVGRGGKEKGEGGEIRGGVWGGRIKEWKRKGEESIKKAGGRTGS